MTIVIGASYGRWVVTGFHDTVTMAGGARRHRVLAKCSCGVEKVVYYSNLYDGKSKSCGCLSREATSERRGTHRRSKTALYKVWATMLQRCTNPKYPKWCNYGGRGIKVCERWLKFENFLEDMGECPEGMSLEREDNAGNYEPDNCIWATASRQGRNRRSTCMLCYNGVTKAVGDWADEYGMIPHTLYNRVKQLGWSIHDALTIPVKARTPKKLKNL